MFNIKKYNKCQNYNLCNEMVPIFISRCTKCDLCYGEWNGGKGTLTEYPNHECPICLETKLCFEQPKCNHPICADCFRIVYFCEIPDEFVESKIGKEPKHPYQDILDQYETLDYYHFEDNPDYPLMDDYIKEWDNWNKLRDKLFDDSYNAKCCLCRVKN